MNIDNSSTGNALSLDGLTIGISISESEDLESLGMGKMVLDQAYIEIARHLLAQGARLAYGGDQREAGYTQQLFDLVRNYDLPDQDVTDSVVNYLAWPLHLKVTEAQRVDLLEVAEVIDLPLDPALAEEFDIDPQTYHLPDTTEMQYVWARSLTAMRERMNTDIDARIVLGGKTDGFTGRYPGIAEETLLALSSRPENRTTVFLLGGFGGCAGELASAVEGDHPRRLSHSFQVTESGHSADYSALCDFYNARHPDGPIDCDGLIERFRSAGVDGLNNALSEPENHRLFHTDDIDEMVALILKGLRKVS